MISQPTRHSPTNYCLIFSRVSIAVETKTRLHHRQSFLRQTHINRCQREGCATRVRSYQGFRQLQQSSHKLALAAFILKKVEG